MKALSNKSVIESYFKAFSAGDMESVLQNFHPDCLIVSVRDAARTNGQLHGTYRTRNQAADFLTNISQLFNTQRFEVETITEGDHNVVYANGVFTHEVKSTGKLFFSTWVQRCIVEDGMIKEYRFYEDSAAYEKAAA